jgi:hypothetical protein
MGMRLCPYSSAAFRRTLYIEVTKSTTSVSTSSIDYISILTIGAGGESGSGIEVSKVNSTKLPYSLMTLTRAVLIL